MVLYDDGDKERVNLDEVAHRWLDGDDAGGAAGPSTIAAGGVPSLGEAAPSTCTITSLC